MIFEDYSSRRRLRETCYSLLTIIIGFISCSIIAMLSYYTYQIATGNIGYCSLWTDIPGRLAIFLIFYYAAGICGALPIPECFRVNSLPRPFILYRLESWRNLLENLFLHFRCNYRGYEAIENDPTISPPRYECNERNFDSSPTPTFHEESKNTSLSETDTLKQYIVRSDGVARYRDVETASSYEDCSISFDSPIPGQIVTMTMTKSSEPRYISDSSISTSTGKSLSVDASSDKLCEVSETLNDRFNALSVLHDENDTPPRTPEIELSLPSYPRFPWRYLRDGSGVPHEAKALHKKNIMTEKQEIGNYTKKQNVEESTCVPKESEHSWITDSDEFNPSANRPLRIPLIPSMTKTGFRSRTVTTPGNIKILGKMKTKIHKRICSCSPPYRYRPYSTAQMSPESGDDSDTIKVECCENSPSIQTKVEQIQKALMKLDPNFQTGASTSTQNTKIPNNTSNCNTAGEISTSRQNIDVFPSKISDSNVNDEASTSRQNIAVFHSNTSNSNTGGGPSTSKQNIDIISSTISDKNVDTEASTSRENTNVFSRKTSNSNAGTSTEASTSEQKIDNFPADEVSTSNQNIDVCRTKCFDGNTDE